MRALETLRKVIAAAGKKSYTFVMGRITPEKLANFPEVDVFVLISCPQLALLDCKEFYAPVIEIAKRKREIGRARRGSRKGGGVVC
mmetsp:Transcript_1969/g.4492  ORF Transcript_1969/g.4492 Transcript_1969/m.4492 type:complete len:86 (+) Transcript_1969:1016-1273(+)